MKTLTLLIVMLLAYCCASAQKMPSDYFDEASKLFEEKKMNKALAGFQFIVDHYPKNELYPKAYYNAGYIYFVKKDYNRAIEIFNNILQSNFREKEDSGGGIMDNPYANYKHKASKLLSEMYFNKGKYDKALYYFSLSDTAFQYLHFCGNEYASNDIATSLRYAKIFEKLKEPDKAIEKLLPSVFITLADNSMVLTELKRLLANKDGIKQEFANSLKNIYSKTFSSEESTYVVYAIKVLGVEIVLPSDYKKGKEAFNTNNAVNEIKETPFYKMVEQL